MSASGYLPGVPRLFTAALGGAEAELDPAGIMNPGVLMRPARTANYHHEREGERQ